MSEQQQHSEPAWVTASRRTGVSYMARDRKMVFHRITARRGWILTLSPNVLGRSKLLQIWLCPSTPSSRFGLSRLCGIGWVRRPVCVTIYACNPIIQQIDVRRRGLPASRSSAWQQTTGSLAYREKGPVQHHERSHVNARMEAVPSCNGGRARPAPPMPRNPGPDPGTHSCKATAEAR